MKRLSWRDVLQRFWLCCTKVVQFSSWFGFQVLVLWLLLVMCCQNYILSKYFPCGLISISHETFRSCLFYCSFFPFFFYFNFPWRPWSRLQHEELLSLYNKTEKFSLWVLLPLIINWLSHIFKNDVRCKGIKIVFVCKCINGWYL